jgi:hypothetical protein
MNLTAQLFGKGKPLALGHTVRLEATPEVAAYPQDWNQKMRCPWTKARPGAPPSGLWTQAYSRRPGFPACTQKINTATSIIRMTAPLWDVYTVLSTLQTYLTEP